MIKDNSILIQETIVNSFFVPDKRLNVNQAHIHPSQASVRGSYLYCSVVQWLSTPNLEWHLLNLFVTRLCGTTNVLFHYSNMTYKKSWYIVEHSDTVTDNKYLRGHSLGYLFCWPSLFFLKGWLVNSLCSSISRVWCSVRTMVMDHMDPSRSDTDRLSPPHFISSCGMN